MVALPDTAAAFGDYGQFDTNFPNRIYVAPEPTLPSPDTYAHAMLHETIHLVRHTHFKANLKGGYAWLQGDDRMRYIREEWIADAGALLVRQRLTGTLPIHLVRFTGAYIQRWTHPYQHEWERDFHGDVTRAIEQVVDHLTALAVPQP